MTKKVLETRTMVMLRGNVVSEMVHEHIYESGLVGELVYPSNGDKFPAVLCIGGSSGVVGKNVANKLAEAGFVAFSVGYFGAPGLPDDFTDLSLEYFLRALEWFMKQPMLAGSKVGVTGSSRGSEAALELASRSPLVGAVVVYVPSGIRWMGIDSRPSWTWKKMPLPYLKWDNEFNDQSGSIAKVGSFNRALDDRSNRTGAEIEVEMAKCPILLISGKDDHLWPSERMASLVVERLKTHEYRFEVKHIAYENAGHRIKVPGLPDSSYVPISEDTVTHEMLDLGGTFDGNKSASEKAWPETVGFFCKYLTNE